MGGAQARMGAAGEKEREMKPNHDLCRSCTGAEAGCDEDYYTRRCAGRRNGVPAFIADERLTAENKMPKMGTAEAFDLVYFLLSLA